MRSLLFFLLVWGWAESRAQTTVGVSAGTSGVGILVGHKMKRIQLQVGYQGYAYQKARTVAFRDTQSVYVQPRVMLGQVMGRVGWQVFPNRPRFHWVVGATYDIRAQREALLSTSTGLTVSGATIAAEDFGEVLMQVKVNPLRPFTGFQWDIHLGKRLVWQNMVGVTYMGPMQLEASYTGFFETTNLKDDIKTIENNLSPLRYLPIYQMGLSWRLR